MQRETRALRRRLQQIDQNLSDEDLVDRLLVHTLVQVNWHRRGRRRELVTPEAADTPTAPRPPDTPPDANQTRPTRHSRTAPASRATKH